MISARRRGQAHIVVRRGFKTDSRLTKASAGQAGHAWRSLFSNIGLVASVPAKRYRTISKRILLGRLKYGNLLVPSYCLRGRPLVNCATNKVKVCSNLLDGLGMEQMIVPLCFLAVLYHVRSTVRSKVGKGS